MGNHFSCISQIIAEPDVIMLKKQQRSEEIGVWKMHRIRVANGMTNNGNSEYGVLQINNNKNNVFQMHIRILYLLTKSTTTNEMQFKRIPEYGQGLE